MKKEIILIRHAKVEIDNHLRCGSSELQYWVEQYDQAAIEEDSLPTKELIELVDGADYLLTSTLSRTIASALKFNKKSDEQNALFNEATLPNVHIPFLKFRAKTWLMILRLLLLMGRGRDDSSLKASKARAKEAACYLLALSLQRKRVVLVGHGGMNFLITQYLRQEGWRVEGRASSRNWGATKLYKVFS